NTDERVERALQENQADTNIPIYSRNTSRSSSVDDSSLGLTAQEGQLQVLDSTPQKARRKRDLHRTSCTLCTGNILSSISLIACQLLGMSANPLTVFFPLAVSLLTVFRASAKIYGDSQIED